MRKRKILIYLFQEVNTALNWFQYTDIIPSIALVCSGSGRSVGLASNFSVSVELRAAGAGDGTQRLFW